MVYGKTFEEVSKLSKPEKVETPFGYKKNVISEPSFSLQVWEFTKKKQNTEELKTDFQYFEDCIIFFYVEEGTIIISKLTDRKGGIETIKLEKGNVLFIPQGLVHRITGTENTLVYLFSNKNLDKSIKFVNRINISNFNIKLGYKFVLKKTSNVLDKYWGKIETIFSDEFTGKRLSMKPGVVGSLEYHINKTEAYFIQSGKLAVILRTGRAKDKPLILNTGESFVIHPGTMHRRIALKDTVLIEVSTKDDDTDSNLVDDGQKYLNNEELKNSYLKEIGLKL